MSFRVICTGVRMRTETTSRRRCSSHNLPDMIPFHQILTRCKIIWFCEIFGKYNLPYCMFALRCGFRIGSSLYDHVCSFHTAARKWPINNRRIRRKNVSLMVHICYLNCYVWQRDGESRFRFHLINYSRRRIAKFYFFVLFCTWIIHPPIPALRTLRRYPCFIKWESNKDILALN